jgi:hypothetical protein
MKLLSLVLLLMLFAVPSFGVGTTTVTKTAKAFGKNGRLMEVVQIDFVGDASTGSVPDTSLTISGYVYKVITNPGSTAPTANYDIVLGDAEDSTLDALASALLNRHTTTTEQVYPKIAGTILVRTRLEFLETQSPRRLAEFCFFSSIDSKVFFLESRRIPRIL